ncbi:MAG TPA: globin, partial [Hyphomonas sp.]|nr:globin [Hyphomonas sp.]HCJ18999.1 globin [Hyphomonas sp.]
QHPEFEDLFAMDTDGGVRGSMLTTCFDCIIGLTEGSRLPRFELQSARLSHQGYGVPESQLDDMFTAIRDTCREAL